VKLAALPLPMADIYGILVNFDMHDATKAKQFTAEGIFRRSQPQCITGLYCECGTRLRCGYDRPTGLQPP
jgi:hypothetical protein